MKVIETEFNGHRFRSRTEARWAVFFDAAGIKYEYEKEGLDLDGRWYLPDFWLPEIKKWLEVKGEEPTEEEVALCQKLQRATGSDVLLAIGPPRPGNQIIWFRSPDDYFGDEDHTTFRFYFADDRRNENEFWLVSGNGTSGSSIGLATHPCAEPRSVAQAERGFRSLFDEPLGSLRRAVRVPGQSMPSVQFDPAPERS